MGRGSIIVNGGGGGIGLPGVQCLAEAGFDVYAGVPEEAEREHLDSSLENVRAFAMDVRSTDSIANAVEELRNHIPPDEMFGLWSNAGVNIISGFKNMTAAEIRQQVEVNVIGTMHFLHGFLPLLRRDHSRVVITGSATGMFAGPGVSVYSATKFALRGFSDALRIELARAGISVSLIEPGLIKSPMSVGARGSVNSRMNDMDDQDRDDFGPFISKIADVSDHATTTPERVAQAVLRAFSGKKPRARYRVGIDAKAVALIRHLPDFAKDSIQRATFGL